MWTPQVENVRMDRVNRLLSFIFPAFESNVVSFGDKMFFYIVINLNLYKYNTLHKRIIEKDDKDHWYRSIALSGSGSSRTVLLN